MSLWHRARRCDFRSAEHGGAFNDLIDAVIEVITHDAPVNGLPTALHNRLCVLLDPLTVPRRFKARFHEGTGSWFVQDRAGGEWERDDDASIGPIGDRSTAEAVAERLNRLAEAG